MSFIKNLEDVKIMCRICLMQSDNMISMDDKIDDKSEDSPQISYALENIISTKINDDVKYPKEICRLCYGNLRLSFDLTILYNKSQNILEKYISSLHTNDRENLLVSCKEGKNETAPLYHLDYPENNNTDSDPDVNITKTEAADVEEDIEEQAAQSQKVVKLKIGAKEKNTVRVKWVEGNKFIIEKNDNASAITTYKCSYCHKRFISKEKLTQHHSACKKFVIVKCEFCNNKFSSVARKQYHVKLKHSADGPIITCEICNEVFKNYNAKSYHKLTRHNTEGKKYTCELCGKAFYIKNSLSQHMECHTRDVSRVVCPVCGKGFHYRGGLFYHMKVHRNERNYICTFCGRRFLNMASLKRHTRIHTGERPYTCSLCPKTFCSITEVKTHERRHTGEKPFHCTYCKKSFLTPYNLKLHKSSHVGTQPCDLCDKSYLNAEVLKFHMEIKHNIKGVDDIYLESP